MGQLWDRPTELDLTNLLFVPAHIDLQFFDPVPQAADRDTQEIGGPHLDALGPLQGILDNGLLDPFEPFIEVQFFFPPIHSGQRSAHLRRQMARLDLPFPGKQTPPLQECRSSRTFPGQAWDMSTCLA